MVPDLGGVVKNGGLPGINGGRVDDLLQVHRRISGVRHEIVEIGEIALVVFAVVETDRPARNDRRQRLLAIRQRRQFERALLLRHGGSGKNHSCCGKSGASCERCSDEFAACESVGIIALFHDAPPCLNNRNDHANGSPRRESRWSSITGDADYLPLSGVDIFFCCGT